MAASGFAYTNRFNKNLPPPAPPWTGFPKYNFIGGHNDPERIPAAALADAATTVLRRRGADLALYNFDGPQGYRGLRDLVVDKVSRRPAIKCSADDVLITSGSGQGIDLDIEGVGKLTFNVKDELKRKWDRVTRLQMHERASQKTPGAYPDITPQIEGKHAAR